MPYPQNLETAKDVEAIVRRKGAVPATIAILDGIPCVGVYNKLFTSYIVQIHVELSLYLMLIAIEILGLPTRLLCMMFVLL